MMSERNGYCSPFIGDGYDLTATIPAQPGRWDEATVHYRPMTAEEESYAIHLVTTGQERSRVAAFSQVFAKKIQSWNIKGRDGKPLEITPENISGLYPAFRDALHNLLDGTVVQEQAKNSD